MHILIKSGVILYAASLLMLPGVNAAVSNDINTAASTDDVTITSSTTETLTSSKTINSLSIATTTDNTGLNLGGNTLTITSGVLAFAGGYYSGTFSLDGNLWTAVSQGQRFEFAQSTGGLLVQVIPKPTTNALLFLGVSDYCSRWKTK